MSTHNEQVKPSAFDVAPAAPEQVEAAGAAVARSERPRWIVPALLGLGLLAVLVVFWLPSRIGPVEIEPTTVDKPEVDSPVVPKSSAPVESVEASPWSDAQMAKQRKEAQEVLAELLEVQELLEQTSVELWAAEPFEQAKVFAAEGDRLYRERRFQEATTNYQKGLADMKVILERTDDALNEQLEKARLAIEAGDREVAEASLEVATAIEPGSTELINLLGRAASLEQLLPLLLEAQSAEEIADLAAAENLLKQATAIDPEHLRTAAELARVSAAHTAVKFNDAMSAGYLALDESNFSAARKAFNAAAGLSPGSSEAASALQEVQAAQTANRLSTLSRKGQAAEDNEQWSEALEAYKQALAIDANILYAQEGFARSSTRAKLDEQFTSAITQPERLSEEAVAQATATLLRQAATISPRGPLLTRQMSELKDLLKLANTPLSLTLRSDGKTDITVYKIARLGLFQQREMSLRPGKYTAVGTRNGYRDVRVTFSLSHESPPQAVEIRCTEPI